MMFGTFGTSFLNIPQQYYFTVGLPNSAVHDNCKMYNYIIIENGDQSLRRLQLCLVKKKSVFKITPKLINVCGFLGLFF